jgi:hypothetical protein
VKAHSKRGRGERYTPFDLLRWVTDTGESRPVALFREFAGVFKGRRQLIWSPGLKALVGLVDKSDEELAEEVKEDAVVLALLTPAQWFAVRFYEQRGELLEVARAGNAGAVVTFVAELVNRFRSRSESARFADVT